MKGPGKFKGEERHVKGSSHLVILKPRQAFRCEHKPVFLGPTFDDADVVDGQPALPDYLRGGGRSKVSYDTKVMAGRGGGHKSLKRDAKLRMLVQQTQRYCTGFY